MYPLLPAPPSMYSSLSESTVLSSAEQRTETVRTFFEASDDFLQFLSSRTGMHEILLYEDTLGVDIKVEQNGFSVSHPPDIPVKPIEMGLRKLFFDVEFTKCLRLSTLRLRCPAAQELTLSPAQYAFLHETKLTITREAGLTDVLMDHNGRSCLFGTQESILAGHSALKQMFNENNLGSFEFRSSLTETGNIDLNNNRTQNFISCQEFVSSPQKATEENWAADVSHQPVQLRGFQSEACIDNNNWENSNSQSSSFTHTQSSNQSGSSNSFGNGSKVNSPDLAPTAAEPTLLLVEEKRKSLRFFLNITDAPRLIGSRGANKRRIEQLTGCTILLHTEKKEYGEFPVEIFASSTKRCEMARQHIIGFLASNSATVDEISASLCGAKNKEIRVCPKVHLDISPKKLPKKHAD